MLNKNIKLINKEALPVGKASLSIHESDQNFNILVFLDNKKIEFSSSDYFEALKLFREYLYEEKSLFPNLKGALKSVYPSRMSRQMSGGEMAYRYVMGKQADDTDLINIFDEIDEMDYSNLVSVPNQLSNYKKWLKSL